MHRKANLHPIIDKAKVIDILLKDYEITCAQIRDMVSYSDRMFGIGITLIAAIFSYGIKENIPKVIVFISFISIALLLFVASIYTAILSLGGYRLYLEEQINELAHNQLLRWEKVVTKIYHNSFPVSSLSVTIATLLVCEIVYGLYVSPKIFQPVTMPIIKGCYTIGGLLLMGSYLKMVRSHSEAYELAKASGKKDM